jgi:hypothetical protein
VRQALELALEALQFALHIGFPESSESQIKKGEKAYQQHRAAITAIKEALAQPEQEPVAWTEKVGGIGFKEPMPNANYKVTATIAPQRKPLTDEQIDGIASKFYPRSYGLDEFARAIEAAHGIKE